jgi:hypothetical protein
MNHLLLIVLSLSSLAACGSTEASDESKSEKYTYEFEFNGCKTGKHSFSSKSEYCEALLDDDLNHGCARSMREDMAAKKDCD